MKLIKPAEISAKIMTLIDEAERELIIVSPYNRITGWNKLINRINKAKKRNVAITWYSRKNNISEDNTKEVTGNLNIKPILIDDLHAKIYFNEAYAVVTSMNMSIVSDDKSIEIGYLTETPEEYDELYDVFRKHIRSTCLKENDSTLNAPPSITSPGTQKKISMDEHHINVIHEHILNRYGTFKFDYQKGIQIEYEDFKKQGCKVQFLTYSSAIRVQIWLPPKISYFKIERAFDSDNRVMNLSASEELDLIDSKEGIYVKYYYEEFERNPARWTKETLQDFKNDLDLLIEITFSKI